MKLIIEHRKTKREINGAFAICCSKNELQQLKSIIEAKLESDFAYGWINIDEFITQPDNSEFDIIKRQKSIPNTEPVSWD